MPAFLLSSTILPSLLWQLADARLGRFRAAARPDDFDGRIVGVSARRREFTVKGPDAVLRRFSFDGVRHVEIVEEGTEGRRSQCRVRCRDCAGKCRLEMLFESFRVSRDLFPERNGGNP